MSHILSVEGGKGEKRNSNTSLIKFPVMKGGNFGRRQSGGRRRGSCKGKATQTMRKANGRRALFGERGETQKHIRKGEDINQRARPPIHFPHGVVSPSGRVTEGRQTTGTINKCNLGKKKGHGRDFRNGNQKVKLLHDRGGRISSTKTKPRVQEL